MYPPHSTGGYEVIWRSCVERLRARGHQVRVLTSDHREEGERGGEHHDVHRELRWYWREHDFPRLSARERLRLERHNRSVLARHLAAHRPEVVTWWPMGGMSLSLIERCRREGLPAVGVVCDDWLVYGPTVDAWQRGLARLGPLGAAVGNIVGAPGPVDFDGAASWVFISRFTLDRAREEGGHRLSRSTVAHAGIDATRFRPGAPHAWEGRLLYAGRVDPRKGITTAVRALGALDSGFRLDVVGDGDPRHAQELRELSASLGVDGRFELHPGVDHAWMAERYTRADALVFPVTWPEPWGLVPLEAMACGTPVIATGTGGSGEYLRHEENCLLVEPSDHAGLAAAAARLRDDEELRSRLREGGLATAGRHSETAFNDAVEWEIQRAVHEAARRQAGGRPACGHA